MGFESELKQYIARVERGLDLHLPSRETRPARLHAAMRYSLEAGGKRLRPVLVLATAELFGRKDETALPAAVAVECIHTYSLIHDDLPCMDNDDLRRGRPTAHRAFDEPTALLAGDALLTHAFALLATAYAAQPPLAQALVAELADAAGSRRLIGGQMEDLLAEKKADATAGELEFIHLNKTAAMLEAALVMGGLVGGADAAAQATLRRAGRGLGLAFQIVDDVLDATADSATLGKTAGKDAKAGKTTYVKLYGLDASRQMAREQTDVALAALRSLPGDTRFLVALVDSLVGRAK
ncbi:polyprenyl synthetase family protein [Opitutus sp. ER46]|uniref:polyprenyl synthetase family protein n=1 Tax=Opitutus sp. ER46 TaxID=2161864 RepID=UPI000D3220F9|nr:farnesyl diphosphate synthase [Opitutus sp. ER46]PTX90770.1 polyprenyl synthetase [Opitutus sp. ER46]